MTDILKGEDSEEMGKCEVLKKKEQLVLDSGEYAMDGNRSVVIT